MRSRAISSSSRTSTWSPALRPISAPRSANTEGVSTFAGSLQSSRATLHDFAEHASALDGPLQRRVLSLPGDYQRLLERGPERSPVL